MKILHVCRYFVHSLVTPRGGGSWELKAIYASPSSQRRVAMSEELKFIQIKHPWLCMGDFNYTPRDGERGTMRGVSTSFVKWKEEAGLIDMGFFGPRFTWNHGTHASSLKSARLDRCLCDSSWRRLYPYANVSHLPISFRSLPYFVKDGCRQASSIG